MDGYAFGGSAAYRPAALGIWSILGIRAAQARLALGAPPCHVDTSGRIRSAGRRAEDGGAGRAKCDSLLHRFHTGARRDLWRRVAEPGIVPNAWSE